MSSFFQNCHFSHPFLDAVLDSLALQLSAEISRDETVSGADCVRDRLHSFHLHRPCVTTDTVTAGKFKVADRVGTVRDDERGCGVGVAVVDAVPQVGKCVEIYIVCGN